MSTREEILDPSKYWSESGIKKGLVGDEVLYPDGTTAKISTGVGNTSGDSAALVGSSLDNGDEIISSPQGNVRRVVRAGETLPANFLK